MRVYKKQLDELATRLNVQIHNLRDEALQTGENPDGVSRPSERTDCESHDTEEERTLPILQTEQELLREVESAQARIERGTFGQCEECESAIAKKRLDALPYARHCIACAKKLATVTASSV